jgi:hypothetical protein
MIWGKKEKCLQDFGGEIPDEKRPPGRPRRRWEDGSETNRMGGHSLD